ncbi:family 10 glycosylhydrolase [Microseira sp. BLCC-F43]|uniref:glycoside hydrolase family 10 protein n=1 Tax=Microseira sp. BLCC-F43 TaxID=3153602 RepID=UPI0035BB38E6
MLKQLVNNLFTTWADGLFSFRRTFKGKAWLAFLAALSMIISVLLTQALAQTGLNDIQGHWAQPCIEELVRREIISGYPDGSFKPSNPVTRAEFATSIAKAFPNVTPVRDPMRFVDIPSNYWAVEAIGSAYRTGFLSGYIGRTFNPNLKITREQVLVALASGLKYTPSQPPAEMLDGVFEDAQDISNYARNAIAAAIEKQLVVNYPDVRSFKPSQLANRGEVAASLCQAMGISGVVPDQYIAKLGTPEALPSPEATPTTPTPPPTVPAVPTTPPPPPTEEASVTITTPPPPPTGEASVTITTPPPPPTGEASVTITTPPPPPTGEAPTVPTPRKMPTEEIRGVWLTNIDSDVLFSPSRLSRALERLHKLHLNTVYPTVWNWGYTLYPSAIARGTIGRSLDPEIGLRGRDILKEIIDQGHKKGMTVIPWFEFGFMAPADSELAQRYPNWILSGRDGTQIWKEGRHDRVWLNPFRPDVQQFIEDLILEIVTKYDIDGIQFDDHFGFPSELGYDPFTVALYQKEHNGQSPPENFKDPEWLRWRADKITQYMQRIYRGIKERKPNVIVSVSPNPQRFSYEFFLTDWETWDKQGLIDELILQVYRDDIARFIGELEQPEVLSARQRIPVGVGIMTGVKPRFVAIPQIQQQVETVRQRNFSGISFFFYESLWTLTQEPSAQRQNAIASLFPEPVKRPAIVSQR